MSIKLPGVILLLILLQTSSIAQTFSNYPYKEEVEANRTVTYAQAIEQYHLMAGYDDRIMMSAAGMSDIGLPIHVVVVDKDGEFAPESARERGKVVLMINNGIHPGEPDGIDATLWLVQNIITTNDYDKLLDHAVIVIIPVYNIGGALMRNSTLRASQNGPEAYGFRGNGQNLDLNRDFIKCDSRNARTFSEIFTRWDPDILIDNHVSNGADYSYVMTMLATQADKLGYHQGQYLRHEMLPDLYKKMEVRSFPMCPYVNVWGTTLDKGLPGFIDGPRYSSGYAALFQTFSFVPETHMLKPYHSRVKATYAFMESMIEFISEHYIAIISSRAKARQEVADAKQMPLRWEQDQNRADTFLFRGYAYEYVTSAVSGLPRLKYYRDRPESWKLPYYAYANVSSTIDVPAAYILPQAYYHVAERLRSNGIIMHAFDRDTAITGSVYRITNVDFARGPYEGHFIHSNVQVEKTSVKKQLLKGDFYIPTNQRAKRYLIEVLEPQGMDAFFIWNFFDGILNRKEGFSDYVFEDEAAEMLRNNPDLDTELKEAIASDPRLKESAFGQLNFIYQRSKYAEPNAMVYPVMRIE